MPICRRCPTNISLLHNTAGCISHKVFSRSLSLPLPFLSLNISFLSTSLSPLSLFFSTSHLSISHSLPLFSLSLSLSSPLYLSSLPLHFFTFSPLFNIFFSLFYTFWWLRPLVKRTLVICKTFHHYPCVSKFSIKTLREIRNSLAYCRPQKDLTRSFQKKSPRI